MTEIELQNKLQELLKLPKETEWVEFKEVKNGTFSQDKIGQYNSALSNEANLREKDFGWLVFGVDNAKNIVGTNYRKDNLDDVKYEIYQNSNLSFKDVYQVYIDQKRVVMFQIIPAQKGQPTKWKGHCYGREGEHLIPLSDEKYQRILGQISNPDWSAQPCEGGSVEDLDEEAIEMAKQGYIKKNFANDKKEAETIRNFSTQRFLEEINATTKKGELTNTALLLFGNKKAELKLGLGFATEIAYLERVYKVDEDFRLPFQKSIYKLVDKISIRQLEFQTKIAGQYTGNNYFRDNYRKEDLRECIANCVAHQDYSKHQRIEVYETIHKEIEFRNAGACLYSKEEFDLIRQRKLKPNRYRNEFLARVMREIGLMEPKGKGHAQIFDYNTKEVYLPLPQVDWENKKDFVLKLYGASLDPTFAKILQQKTDLEATEILLLDQVQKGFRIDQKIFYNLKKQGLVEGTPTKGRLSLNLEILLSGAKAISNYRKQKEFDEEYCIKKIYSFVKECNQKKVPVKTIDIFDHIENDLTIRSEKEKKINYLNNHIIKKMRKHGKYKIYSTKKGKSSSWFCIV